MRTNALRLGLATCNFVSLDLATRRFVTLGLLPGGRWCLGRCLSRTFRSSLSCRLVVAPGLLAIWLCMVALCAQWQVAAHTHWEDEALCKAQCVQCRRMQRTFATPSMMPWPNGFAFVCSSSSAFSSLSEGTPNTASHVSFSSLPSLGYARKRMSIRRFR